MWVEQFLIHAYLQLLGFFPLRYRLEYQPELEFVIRQVVKETAPKGWFALLKLAWRELRDLPRAIVREHVRERRKRAMEPNSTSGLTGERISGLKLLVFFSPFLISILFVLGQNTSGTPTWLRIVLLFGIVLYFLLVLGIGLYKRFPRWTAVPVTGILLFILVFMYISSGTGGGLWILPWPSTSLGKVLTETAQDFLTIFPALLLGALVLLLSAVLPFARPLARRLRQDWSIISLIFYCLAVFPIITQDEYNGLWIFQVLSLVVLVGGAWLTLRQASNGQRVLTLIGAILLSLVVLSLGIYGLYPSQPWAQHTPFPRWWEALYPLLFGLALIVVLLAPALLSLVPAGKVKEPVQANQVTNP